MADTKVGRIVAELNSLESSLDALVSSTGDMKSSLGAKARDEAGRAMERVREMAAAEAESIIAEARSSATAEASKIEQAGKERVEQIRARIDGGFDDAVKYAVSEILRR